MKIRIVEGTTEISSDGEILFHTFDGSTEFNALGKNYWTAPETLIGDYEEITLPTMTAEVIEVGFAKQEVKDSTSDKTKKIMSLPVKGSFAIGEKVFLKVKTLGLIGKKLKVEVRQAVEKQLTEKNQKIEALCVMEMTVGKITQSEDAKNKYEASNLKALENIALKEMVLEPSTEDEKKNWKEILARSGDKKIKLYFHIEVLDVNDEVTYKGDDANDPKNFSTLKPFELIEEGKCFCNREFNADDIKAFYNSKQLFTHPKCPLSKEQKTYESFATALNKAMKDYDINTCLRKAHFLAQVQVESDSLNTTIEYATGWDYDHSTHYDGYSTYKNTKDPLIKKKNQRAFNRYNECIAHGHSVKGYGPKYKGRGLLQLTWKDTYQAYFTYLNHPEYITDPDLVANNLENACNASAWYWKYYSKWKNLNFAADRDDVYYINIGINGGFNHFDVRIRNIKKILELMKVKENCKNINNLTKELGKYKYSTSDIKNSGFGKKNKDKFEKYDDK